MGVFNNFPYANFHELNADWILEQVRKVTDEWEEYRTDMNLWKLGVDDQLAEFQAWFDNLDVQDEVRTVINELIRSGEFIEITSPQIVSATEAWLAAHITPTTPAVDDTLSISGAAADSKVTGDRITDLKEDLTDSLYTSRYLLTAIDYLSIPDYYLNFNGEAEARSGFSISDYIRINKDDVVSWTLRGGTGSSYPIVVIYNLDKTFFGREAYGAGRNTDVTGSWTATKECYIRICCFSDYATPVFRINNSGHLLYVNKKLTEVNNVLDTCDKNIINKNNVKSGMTLSATSIISSPSGNICFTELVEGSKYVFSRSLFDNRVCAVAFSQTAELYSPVTGYNIFNSANNIIEQNDNYYPYTFIVPEGYPYFAVLFYNTGYESNYTIDEVLDSLYLRKYNDIENSLNSIENETGALNPIYDLFSDEIESVTEDVISKTTSKALLLGVITDTHIETAYDDANCVSMHNMKRVNENLSFDVAINMGDIIDGGEDKDTEQKFIQKGINRLINVGAKKFAALVGNHDNNGLNPDELFTNSELYGMILRMNETEVVRDGITSNFYIDYPELKIRLIFVDSVYQSGGFSTETITWTDNVLTNLPQNYKAVFISHEPTRWSLISTATGSMVNSSEMEAVLTSHESVICGWIHGHTHFDNVSYVMGFPEISITCGKPDQFPSTNFPTGAVAPARTIGDVTQDAWDSVLILPSESKFELVRFGAGSNRTVPFRT